MVRRTTARKAAPEAAAPDPAPCEVCKGTGQVAVTVRVGRRHRLVGQQEGMCLSCFGSGEAPTA